MLARLLRSPCPVAFVQRPAMQIPSALRSLAALALAVGLTALSGQAQAQGRCPEFYPGGQPPALLRPQLTQRVTLLCNDEYAVAASGATLGPLWSAEHLTADMVAAARGTVRRGRFHEEDRLPPEDRSLLSDYRGSGFDRGHMTPSGDMPDLQSQQQTFSLANMVPQTA